MKKAIWIIALVLALPWIANPGSGAEGASREQAVKLLDEMKTDVESMEKSHEAVARAADKLSEMYGRLSAQADRLARLAATEAGATKESAKGFGGGPSDLATAARQMQEMQRNLNAQFSLLQREMQDENRKYQTISNASKSKHDTVKNSIGNIR